MGQYLEKQLPNRESLTTFLGFWSTLINALFAYMGTELIGVTVGEAQNPRKNIPIAIRRTFWRILIFYIGGVFVVGLIVPRTDPTLFVANSQKVGAAASPFVVATTLVGIKVLNHVINGAILIFVLSAANSDLYIGSRTLYGLAVEGKAMAVFKKVNRLGVPYPALILCTAFCALAYLNVSASSQRGAPSQIPSLENIDIVHSLWLVCQLGFHLWRHNLDVHPLDSHVSFFFSFRRIFVCSTTSNSRFMEALRVQGYTRDDLPYKAPFQPWGSYFALIATGIITFFKGYDTFIPFKVDTFVTSYIAIPTFCVLFAGYKYCFKTKFISPDQVDLVSGKREIDEEEEKFLAEQAQLGPRTWWQRAWDSL